MFLSYGLWSTSYLAVRGFPDGLLEVIGHLFFSMEIVKCEYAKVLKR